MTTPALYFDPDGRSPKELARWMKSGVTTGTPSGGGTTTVGGAGTGADVTRVIIPISGVGDETGGYVVDNAAWPVAVTRVDRGTDAVFWLSQCTVFCLHGRVSEAGPAGKQLTLRYYAGDTKDPDDADFLPMGVDADGNPVDAPFPVDEVGDIVGDDVTLTPGARAVLFVRTRAFLLP